jgi:hypothetical protein
MVLRRLRIRPTSARGRTPPRIPPAAPHPRLARLLRRSDHPRLLLLPSLTPPIAEHHGETEMGEVGFYYGKSEVVKATVAMALRDAETSARRPSVGWYHFSNRTTPGGTDVGAVVWRWWWQRIRQADKTRRCWKEGRKEAGERRVGVAVKGVAVGARQLIGHGGVRRKRSGTLKLETRQRRIDTGPIKFSMYHIGCLI